MVVHVVSDSEMKLMLTDFMRSLSFDEGHGLSLLGSGFDPKLWLKF